MSQCSYGEYLQRQRRRRLARIIVEACLVALAFAVGHASAQTSRPAVAALDPATYRVGVVGDNQVGSATFSQICQQLARERIDVLCGLGDHIQNGGQIPSEWLTQWAQPLTPIAHLPRWGCLGNHDDVAGYALNVWPSELHPLTSVYGPEIGVYSAFTLGPVRWVCLDTNEQPTKRIALFPGGEERRWLEAEVASSAWRSAAFRVVAFHQPDRVTFWDGGCWYPQLPERADLARLLASARADLVLNGHSHAFGRGHLVGDQAAHQIISGGGGGWLDATRCWNWPEVEAAEARHHYLTIDVSPAALIVRACSPAGVEFDRVLIPRR